MWLQPFGYGDGGGGATDWSIRFAEFAKDCDGVPRVEFASASAFCDALHDQHARGADFPDWFGELDMEIHRGTLTSQAWIKKANREAEEALRLAEIVTALSEPEAQAREGFKQTLDRAWKLTLLNQFHDILPGSSIGWVYEDAKRDHAEIQALVTPIIEAGFSRGDLDPTPSVFNPTSTRSVSDRSPIILRTGSGSRRLWTSSQHCCAKLSAHASPAATASARGWASSSDPAGCARSRILLSFVVLQGPSLSPAPTAPPVVVIVSRPRVSAPGPCGR